LRCTQPILMKSQERYTADSRTSFLPSNSSSNGLHAKKRSNAVVLGVGIQTFSRLSIQDSPEAKESCVFAGLDAASTNKCLHLSACASIDEDLERKAYESLHLRLLVNLNIIHEFGWRPQSFDGYDKPDR
jgi:hypothetical protein